MDSKAFEHEHNDWPAPESIYRETELETLLGNCQLALTAVAAATLTRLTFDGMRSLGTLSGYTTNFVSRLEVAVP